MGVAGANASQSLSDKDAVVLVELDDIGNGSERDEVDKLIEPRLRLLRIDASLAQERAQCKKHLIDDADARKGLGRKSRGGEVRVDNAGCLRKLCAGQVVVRHNDVDAERVGALHRRH